MLQHNVNITDDSNNWLKWGELVRQMVNVPDAQRPHTVQDLQALMKAHNVLGQVKGAGGRAVAWMQYNDDVTQPLIIPLPTSTMLDLDQRTLAAIAGHAPHHRSYPLPVFYAAIFGNAPKVDLSKKELQDMGLRRLGEYVINECM